MSWKSKLRVLVACLTLEAGVIFGVPMRPEQIKELMHQMNQPKLAHVLKEEADGGEGGNGEGGTGGGGNGGGPERTDFDTKERRQRRKTEMELDLGPASTARGSRPDTRVI